MKFRNLINLLPLLAGFILGSTLSAAVTTGEAAPDFTLVSTEGNSHSLSDFKGKFVVLEWLNHNCPFVAKFYNAGEMQRIQKEWTEQGVVWLAINSTNPDHQDYKTVEEANKLSKKHGAAHTALLMDESGEVGKLYAARTTPHMYVINPEGILIYQGAIDSISDARASSIPNATNYVVAALKAAKSGAEIAMSDTRPYGCTVKY